ncbi:hypothetical protein HDU76_002154 [Blyttiomyces sp. JEL0837]|nr:hypothetical protein HDU76_002154 [Blyttiomyces sp. JEL0837]
MSSSSGKRAGSLTRKPSNSSTSSEKSTRSRSRSPSRRLSGSWDGEEEQQKKGFFSWFKGNSTTTTSSTKSTSTASLSSITTTANSSTVSVFSAPPISLSSSSPSLASSPYHQSGSNSPGLSSAKSPPSPALSFTSKNANSNSTASRPSEEDPDVILARNTLQNARIGWPSSLSISSSTTTTTVITASTSSTYTTTLSSTEATNSGIAKSNAENGAFTTTTTDATTSNTSHSHQLHHVQNIQNLHNQHMHHLHHHHEPIAVPRHFEELVAEAVSRTPPPALGGVAGLSISTLASMGGVDSLSSDGVVGTGIGAGIAGVVGATDLTVVDLEVRKAALLRYAIEVDRMDGIKRPSVAAASSRVGIRTDHHHHHQHHTSSNNGDAVVPTMTKSASAGTKVKVANGGNVHTGVSSGVNPNPNVVTQSGPGHTILVVATPVRREDVRTLGESDGDGNDVDNGQNQRGPMSAPVTISSRNGGTGSLSPGGLYGNDDHPEDLAYSNPAASGRSSSSSSAARRRNGEATTANGMSAQQLQQLHQYQQQQQQHHHAMGHSGRYSGYPGSNGVDGGYGYGSNVNGGGRMVSRGPNGTPVQWWSPEALASRPGRNSTAGAIGVLPTDSLRMVGESIVRHGSSGGAGGTPLSFRDPAAISYSARGGGSGSLGRAGGRGVVGGGMGAPVLGRRGSLGDEDLSGYPALQQQQLKEHALQHDRHHAHRTMAVDGSGGLSSPSLDDEDALAAVLNSRRWSTLEMFKMQNEALVENLESLASSSSSSTVATVAGVSVDGTSGAAGAALMMLEEEEESEDDRKAGGNSASMKNLNGIPGSAAARHANALRTAGLVNGRSSKHDQLLAQQQQQQGKMLHSLQPRLLSNQSSFSSSISSGSSASSTTKNAEGLVNGGFDTQHGGQHQHQHHLHLPLPTNIDLHANPSLPPPTSGPSSLRVVLPYHRASVDTFNSVISTESNGTNASISSVTSSKSSTGSSTVAVVTDDVTVAMSPVSPTSSTGSGDGNGGKGLHARPSVRRQKPRSSQGSLASSGSGSAGIAPAAERESVSATGSRIRVTSPLKEKGGDFVNDEGEDAEGFLAFEEGGSGSGVVNRELSTSPNSAALSAEKPNTVWRRPSHDSGSTASKSPKMSSKSLNVLPTGGSLIASSGASVSSSSVSSSPSMNNSPQLSLEIKTPVTHTPSNALTVTTNTGGNTTTTHTASNNVNTPTTATQSRLVIWADERGKDLEVFHDYDDYMSRVFELREQRIQEMMAVRVAEEQRAIMMSMGGGSIGMGLGLGVSGIGIGFGGGGADISGVGGSGGGANGDFNGNGGWGEGGNGGGYSTGGMVSVPHGLSNGIGGSASGVGVGGKEKGVSVVGGKGSSGSGKDKSGGNGDGKPSESKSLFDFLSGGSAPMYAFG